MIDAKPTKRFTGYPDGKRKHFVPGIPVRVADEYADMLFLKGLIEPPKRQPKRKPDQTERSAQTGRGRVGRSRPTYPDERNNT